MSETPEHPTAPTSVATTPPPVPAPPPPPANDGRPSRLAVAALWVAIVAGVVFTVAVIFFSGFVLGRHAGGGGFHHRQFGHDHEFGMMFPHRGPPMGPMGPWGPGPWQQGPGSGPGQGAPGSTATPPVPSTSPAPRP
jgi:hypothetical protein